MEKAELAGKYLDFLKREGYVPELDADGDVRFKREGLVYFILVDPKDPVFFRVLLPNIWQSTDDASRREALEAMAEMAARVKVAKLLMSQEGRVSAVVENFISTPEEGMRVFDRCLAATLAAAKQFWDKMPS